jgi:hypothetical protein
VTDETESLIARLAYGVPPVKRLAPPVLRAAIWLGVIATLGILLVMRFANIEMFVHRITDPRLALELTGTLLTGILAVIAAFELSLPDRPIIWSLLPAPAALLWLASSGYSCWRQWIVRGPDGLGFGETADCFLWIVGFGVPLAVALFFALRRAQPLAPGPVAALAGLGVASLAAFLLQFFHPFDATFIDLGLHLVAVAVVVLLARAAARPALNAF